MLAVTSAYLDSVLGSGLSPDTLHWTAANVQYSLNRLISIPETRYGDKAWMGILSVLNAEILAGSGVNIGTYSRGLAKMLRHRGGLESLQGRQSTNLFVTFLLVTPAGKAQSAYLDHGTPDEEGRTEVKYWTMNHNRLILALKSLG